MAYARCQCCVGDIPHPTEAVHKRKHSRCTRAVKMQVRRVRDTNGRKADGPWYDYCEPCASAIHAYLGSYVECRPAAETVTRKAS